MTRLLALIIALLSLGAPAANASQEGQLSFGAFSVASPGIGESGPIVVNGEANRGAILSLHIAAFGKEIALAPEHLAKLADASPNGIQLSYEGGYRGLGGRTLYIVFSRGFTSGQVATVRVAVDEEGGITVVQGRSQ